MRPDVAIVSLGTTFGWRHADAELQRALEAAGCTTEVVAVEVGAAARLRRTLALTDLVEAIAARRSAARITARTAIFSSITAALLAAPKVPYAVRFDTIAALSRPGWAGAWQRRREPVVLAGADLLLPWSQAADDAAARAVRHARREHPPSLVLPVPIEPLSQPRQRDAIAVAYAADPRKRGLELLCRAWTLAGLPGARLLIAGIAPQLAEAHVSPPPTVELVGRLGRGAYLDLVSRARLFVNASRFEDWGLAELEALSAGTPLVTVPSAGPYAALPLARALAPALVAADGSPESLATALRAGWALGERQRAAYATAAAGLLAPYRPAEVSRRVRDELVPALRRSWA